MINNNEIDWNNWEQELIQKSEYIDGLHGYSKEEEKELLKSLVQTNLTLSNTKEEFLKGFGADLQKQFPNGGWRTINGSHVFVNGRKVVAGLDGFNKEIDKFFEGKKKKEESKEKKERSRVTEKDIHSGITKWAKNEQKPFSLKVDDQSTEYHNSFLIEPSGYKDSKYDGVMISFEDGVYEVFKQMDDEGGINTILETKSLQRALNSLENVKPSPTTKTAKEETKQQPQKGEEKQPSNVKERVTKNSANATVEELKESKHGFKRVADPKSVAEKINKYTDTKVTATDVGIKLVNKEPHQEQPAPTEKKPKGETLSPRAKSILKDSKKMFLSQTDPKKMQSMIETVKKNIAADENGREKIGMGLDEDMVAAGKKFLNDKDVKDHLEFITKELKEPKQFKPEKESETKNTPNKKPSSNVSTKSYKDLDSFGKQSLNEEKTETLSKLHNLASKIDEKYLSQKTRDKLNQLVEDIYANTYGADSQDSKRLYESKSVAESLKYLKGINNKLLKEDSYALEGNDVANIQNVLVEAAKEQLNRQTTEKKNYKLDF